MKPTERDKQVQVILTVLSPVDHFEDVMFALKGLDYPEEMLLEWMETDNYDQRPNHNEKEKLTRFRSAQTRAEAEESGYHARGFNTLRNLYIDAGLDKLQLQMDANAIADEDVEYISGDQTTTKKVRKVQRHTQ